MCSVLVMVLVCSVIDWMSPAGKIDVNSVRGDYKKDNLQRKSMK